MIEALNVELWTTQPASLRGLAGIDEPVSRLVCRYFPPEVQFSTDVLDQADPHYLSYLDETYPAGEFEVDRVIQLKLDNGGAVYLLGPEQNGKRLGLLWKLIEGWDVG